MEEYTAYAREEFCRIYVEDHKYDLYMAAVLDFINPIAKHSCRTLKSMMNIVEIASGCRGVSDLDYTGYDLGVIKEDINLHCPDYF